MLECMRAPVSLLRRTLWLPLAATHILSVEFNSARIFTSPCAVQLPCPYPFASHPFPTCRSTLMRRTSRRSGFSLGDKASLYVSALSENLKSEDYLRATLEILATEAQKPGAEGSTEVALIRDHVHSPTGLPCAPCGLPTY